MLVSFNADPGLCRPDNSYVISRQGKPPDMMTEKNSRPIYPTPAEDAEINRQIAEDPDNREWIEEDWASAKSTEELFPEAARAARKRQADLDAGRTEYITLLLDRDTINWFKAQTGEDGDTDGTRWTTLAEKTLQEHARREAKV